MAPARMWGGTASTAASWHIRCRIILILAAVFVHIAVPGGVVPALAAGCATDSQGQVSVTGASASCTIAPASTVSRVTAAGAAQVQANGVQIAVPYGVAATAQGGGVIILDQDTLINIQASGGNQGLVATGAGGRIIADGITLEGTLLSGGDVAAHSQAGAQIQRTDVTVDIGGPGGGKTALLADSGAHIPART